MRLFKISDDRGHAYSLWGDSGIYINITWGAWETRNASFESDSQREEFL